jgi:hypothetical protein
MHPEFKLTFGYAIVTQGSELPIAWFVSPLAAHEWVRANRGNYVPLDVVDCAKANTKPRHARAAGNRRANGGAL